MICRAEGCYQSAVVVVVAPGCESLTEVCSDCYVALGWEFVAVVKTAKGVR